MRAFLFRLTAMMRKEIYHILREPRTLYMALGMPIVMIFLFGYAVSFDLENIPLAVLDLDQTAASRSLIEAFTANSTFVVAARVRTIDDIEPLFRRGNAQLALVIPHGYARQLDRNEPAEVQVLADGADSNTAAIANGYIKGIALFENRRVIAEQGVLSMSEPLSPRVRVRFNPQLRSALFIVPGIIAVIMAIMGVMLTGLTIAREWEQGSMEQLFATPIGGFEVIVGKLIPYYIIGMVQVLLVLTVGATLFDVPIHGSIALIFLLSSLFLIGMLGQGILISVITRSQQLSSQFGIVTSLLPALLLSGFLFLVEDMPAPLRLLSRIVPARYFVSGLRGVMLKAASFDILLPALAALALFDVIVLTLAIALFRRSLD